MRAATHRPSLGAMRSSRIRSFLGGVLVGNSAPHLATAVTGRRHLTPLAGPGSGPGVNAAWGVLNLATGLLLVSRGPRTERWDDDLVAFEAGVCAFAAWMAGSERALRVNTGR